MLTAAAAAGRVDRIPFEPIVSLRAVWLGAVLWAPLVGAFEALWPELGAPSGLEALALNGTSILLAYGAAREAVAARSRGRAVAWMAAGGAVTGLILAVETVFFGGPYVVTSLVGIAWACEYAAWRSVLALLLYTRPEAVSHERVDRATMVASLWAVVPYLIYRVIYGVATLPRSRQATDTTAEAVNLALLGALPVVVALLSALRMADRRRWLGRVQEGQFSGWRLVEAPQSKTDLPLLLTWPRPARLLARLESGEGGSEPKVVPVAAVGEALPAPAAGPATQAAAGAVRRPGFSVSPWRD